MFTFIEFMAAVGGYAMGFMLMIVSMIDRCVAMLIAKNHLHF